MCTQTVQVHVHLSPSEPFPDSIECISFVETRPSVVLACERMQRPQNFMEAGCQGVFVH